MVSEGNRLERALGPIPSAALLAGTVIGTGIFLVPATMARETGSVAGVFIIWLLGAFLSLCGALSYAELGATMPEAGGEYAFLKKAYSPVFGFLFGWQHIVIGKTGSIAAIGLASSLFLGYLFEELKQDFIRIGWLQISGIQLVAMGWIALLTLPNVLGVAKGGLIQSTLTLFKLAAIFVLIVIALQSGNGNWNHLKEGVLTSPELDFSDYWAGWGAALAAALWAYDGWNNLTLVSGEIRHAETTIPRVLILGLLLVAGIYMLTNLAYFYILPLTRVQHSIHVAQDMAFALKGQKGAQLLTLTAVLSTLAALNGAILSGARVFYAMSRDGLLFQGLAQLHPVYHTPGRALLLQSFLAMFLVLFLGHDQAAFERILDYALFGTWAFYGLSAFGVIRLRQRHPELHRPFRTPGYPFVPCAFSLVALSFCGNIAYRRPDETLMGLALMSAGLPLYYLFNRQKA